MGQRANSQTKQSFRLLGYALLFILLIGMGIAWDIYKWHSFQEVTNSDIGYFKWHFLFNSGTR